ncbi:MAG: RluA family pseudouridine synthase [Clostridia bacterium]|nr:RluA family pseudouridine synthase [Clostridia bacterium]
MQNDLKYTIDKEDENLYIKELLQRRFRFSSRLIRKLKVEGGVFVNGNDVKLNQKGRAGDILSVVYPKETSYFDPENIPLDIIYEDVDLLVVNKQPGLVVHPTKNYQSGTLANALAFYLNQNGQAYKIRFVNRLDRDTSGLIIIAKNSHCQDFLVKEMKENRVVKMYLAVVYGIIEENEGVIDLPIDKDQDHVARRKVIESGYASITHYKVLKRFYPKDTVQNALGYSLLELKLDTGRTHQIRVHMTHIGHPILGDNLYGEVCGYAKTLDWMPRQALHAASLEFQQPTTGEKLRLTAPLPQDIEDGLERISAVE